MRGVEETEEERAARPMTRGEAVNWYRSGGQHLVEQEAEVASLSGTWKQFHLMTRGRQEPRDEDQVLLSRYLQYTHNIYHIPRCPPGLRTCTGTGAGAARPWLPGTSW